MSKTMNKKLCSQAAARVEKLLDQGKKAAARSLYHKTAAAGCASSLSGLGYDCAEAQTNLRAARSAKRVGEAWEISNRMRANGCSPSLDGIKRKRRGKKRRK